MIRDLFLFLWLAGTAVTVVAEIVSLYRTKVRP
jgi:hypothetical protein